jgi:K+-transporting ATPase A subunit
MVPLVNMQLGEIVFGGLGTGLYSIVLVALLGLFLTGLMVGKTPEYLGKTIGPEEVKLIVLYTLVGPLAIPALALAGHFALQPIRPHSLGTLPTDTLLFGSVLVGTALIVGALTYFPALALGPVVEQLIMAGSG